MTRPALGKRAKVGTVIDDAIDIGSRNPFAGLWNQVGQQIQQVLLCGPAEDDPVCHAWRERLPASASMRL